MLTQQSERRIEIAKDLVVGLSARPFEDIFRDSRMIEEVHCERDKVFRRKSFDDVTGKFIQGSDCRNHDDAGKRPWSWRQGQETADRARSARNSYTLDCHETFLTCPVYLLKLTNFLCAPQGDPA